AIRPAISTGCTKCCSTCRNDKMGIVIARAMGSGLASSTVCTSVLLHASNAPNARADARRLVGPADRHPSHDYSVSGTHSLLANSIARGSCPVSDRVACPAYAAWESTRSGHGCTDAAHD